MSQRRITNLLQEEDKRRICEGFEKLELELAFEVLEAWEERRNDDFVGALESLRTLREVMRDICM